MLFVVVCSCFRACVLSVSLLCGFSISLLHVVVSCCMWLFVVVTCLSIVGCCRSLFVVVVRYLLHVARYSLSVVYCLLFAVRCLLRLFVVCSSLFVVGCLLIVVLAVVGCFFFVI